MASLTAEEKRKLESSQIGNFSRLARRLSQKEKRSQTEERKRALRQRSVSLDCGDQRQELLRPDGPHVTSPRPAECGGTHLRLPSPALSHSSTSPGRLNRRAGSTGSKNKKQEGVDSQRRKKNSYNDIQALFDAVEHQDLDSLVALLQDYPGLDVNAVNRDDLTALDVAVMTNHVPMTRLLLDHGARESPKFYKRCGPGRGQCLDELVVASDQQLQGSGLYGGEPDVSREAEDFHNRLLKRMLHGYEHAGIPEPPAEVRLTVSSASSLLVTFTEPDCHNGAFVTRYKVEWSCYPDFHPVAGEFVTDDPTDLQFDIADLAQGNAYYVRVSACNMKGWSLARTSQPLCATPSSWREVDDTLPRCTHKLRMLDDLFGTVRAQRPSDTLRIRDSDADSPGIHPRKAGVRKSIKNLFSSTGKFCKTLRRGVYLAAVLYHEDRVLVTNDDLLPVVEADDVISGSALQQEFHWLMKVACTWEDVRVLRGDMDKASNSSALQLRGRLLQAAAQLQSALGVQDLGQFYWRPVKDAESGALVLVTAQRVRDVKSVSTSSTKWTALSKLQRKVPSGGDGAQDILMAAVEDIIAYSGRSATPLQRGLYLGYLKLSSSMDHIRILAPANQPNVPPYERIRACPNVTRDEWQHLRNLSCAHEGGLEATEEQRAFVTDICRASKQLLTKLGLSEDAAVSHRLYDLEVIELNEDVTLLLLLPPADAVCSGPGSVECLPQRADLLSLPLSVFEINHLGCYNRSLLQRFSRLSALLEADMQLAQQAHREALSSEELAVTRARTDQVTAQAQRLEDVWKGARWTVDIVSYARDKSLRGGLPLAVVYCAENTPRDSPVMDVRTAQQDLDSVTSCNSSDMGYHSDRSSGEVVEQTVTSPAEACPCECHRVSRTPAVTCRTCCACAEVWQRAGAPGTVRVYAAYNTGLARGTSVKLQITPRTTAREVRDLVVQQLARAALAKGIAVGHLAEEDQYDEFCLCAVIGARERVLRDEYTPLSLQNPWTKGRLFVRMRAEPLAALEQGQVTTV